MRNKFIAKLQNSVSVGIILGLFVPLIAGTGVWYLMKHVKELEKADLLYIGCIALNGLLMNYFNKQDKEQIGRGILSITFVWAFAFFFYKILQEPS